jgi:hypothetical protein
LASQQHLAACYVIIEYTIAAVCQSDELTDDEVSSVLGKLLDMFHGCIFLIDQIIDHADDKAVRIERYSYLLTICMSDRSRRMTRCFRQRYAYWGFGSAKSPSRSKKRCNLDCINGYNTGKDEPLACDTLFFDDAFQIEFGNMCRNFQEVSRTDAQTLRGG